MRIVACAIASLLVACGASPATSPPSNTTGPSAGSTAHAADHDTAVLARICQTATCTGPLARLEIWRDAQGGIGRIIFDGDIDGCSHPPRTYYDRDGNETLTIPFEPVQPGSPEALEYQRSQDEQRAGLIESRSLLCRDLAP